MLSGPPCETWSSARFLQPPPEYKPRWPRPLRSADRPWGIDALSARELRHLLQGSQLMLTNLCLDLEVAVHGGGTGMEDPHTPSDESHPSIWRTAAHKSYHMEFPTSILLHIQQWQFGADSGVFDFWVLHMWRAISGSSGMLSTPARRLPCTGLTLKPNSSRLRVPKNILSTSAEPWQHRCWHPWHIECELKFPPHCLESVRRLGCAMLLTLPVSSVHLKRFAQTSNRTWVCYIVQFACRHRL